MGRRIEAVLRPIGRHLSEPGYRKGNPLIPHQNHLRSPDNFGVVKGAGVIANKRRFFAAHFKTVDGNAYKVDKYKGKLRVRYEGKVSRRSLLGERLREATQRYASHLNELDGASAR